MKQTLLHNLKFIAFGLVLAAGISAYAAWSAPSAAAPGNNIDVPLHVGPTQVKTSGSCTPGNCGGLSVGPFAVFQNAEFDQQVFLNGMVRGGLPTDTDSQVTFGDSRVVNGSVNGNVNAAGALQSSNLANNSSGTLCAGTDGTIVLCGAAPTVTENYAVPAQTLVYAMPDYAYTPGGQKYIPSICLSSLAKRDLNFTISYTTDTGQSVTTKLSVPFGQQCSNQSPSGIVLSAPHTQVGDATNKCTYEGNDTTYQSPAYQGYTVKVDPSLRCP